MNCRHPNNNYGTSGRGFSSSRGGGFNSTAISNRHGSITFPSTQIDIQLVCVLIPPGTRVLTKYFCLDEKQPVIGRCSQTDLLSMPMNSVNSTPMLWSRQSQGDKALLGGITCNLECVLVKTLHWNSRRSLAFYPTPYYLPSIVFAIRLICLLEEEAISTKCSLEAHHFRVDGSVLSFWSGGELCFVLDIRCFTYCHTTLWPILFASDNLQLLPL